MEKEFEGQELLEATPEIVRKRLALTKELSEVMDSGDNARASRLQEELDLMNEKYNFYDRIFEENGKLGVKDVLGNVRIPALYTDFSELYHFDQHDLPMGAADESGKFALVAADGTGKPLTDFVYDGIQVRPSSENIVCSKGGKFGIISREGKKIVPTVLDACGAPHKAITVVQAGGKFGLVTEMGMYVEPVYDEIRSDGGWVTVRMGEKWGYLDLMGYYVTKENFSSMDSGLKILMYMNFNF